MGVNRRTLLAGLGAGLLAAVMEPERRVWALDRTMMQPEPFSSHTWDFMAAADQTQMLESFRQSIGNDYVISIFAGSEADRNAAHVRLISTMRMYLASIGDHRQYTDPQVFTLATLSDALSATDMILRPAEPVQPQDRYLVRPVYGPFGPGGDAHTIPWHFDVGVKGRLT